MVLVAIIIVAGVNLYMSWTNDNNVKREQRLLDVGMYTRGMGYSWNGNCLVMSKRH